MERFNLKSVMKTKVFIPNDFHWRLFDALISDLEIGEELPTLRGAIRNRSVPKLLEALTYVEERCTASRMLPSTAENCFKWGQISAFLKKFPFSGQDTKTPALKTFFKAERVCNLYNECNYKSLESLDRHHPAYFGILEEVRDDIRKLILDAPSLDSVVGSAVHGPGVSIGDQYKKGRVTSYYKYALLPYTVTRCTLPYARLAIEADPRWLGALINRYRHSIGNHYGPICMDSFWSTVFEVVDGSRVSTVPKNAKTDRVIAIEPLMNVYLQLGVGAYFQRCLYRWGYDLNDQSKNIALAKEGSLTDELVTLDLSAASDSISLKICELLLPPAWFDLLLDLRSPQGVVQGSPISFSKISSMGNGFTFALETLIFGALARCAIRRTKSVFKSAVYGDDIIVPTTAAPFLISLLELAGFTVNTEKSFSAGPFRESCGGDFFLGQDVRPVYLKKKVTSMGVLLYVHNSFHRLTDKLPWHWCLTFENVRKLCLKYIPKSFRRFFSYYPSETLDTYFFSHQPTKIYFQENRKFYRCHFQLQTVAEKFNGRSNFWFRKLMVNLRGSPPKMFHQTHRLPSTGNAFDITKRDRTRVTCVRVEHGDPCSLPKTDYLLANGFAVDSP